MPEANPYDNSPDELRGLISSNRCTIAINSLYFSVAAALGLKQIPELTQAGVEVDYAAMAENGLVAGVAAGGIYLTAGIIRAKREQNVAARAALQAQAMAAHESINPPEQQ